MKIQIVVPATIDVVANPATGELVSPEYTFARSFVCNNLLTDPKWAATMSSLYLAWELRGLFRDAKPGDSVELTADQHAALRDRVEKPTNPHQMALALQVRPYFDAILFPVTKNG